MAETLEQRAARLAGNTAQTGIPAPDDNSLEARAARMHSEQPTIGQVDPNAGLPPKQPPGFWDKLYGATVGPIIAHPSRNIGGLVGRGISGIGATSGQPELMAAGAIAAGLGGAVGQDIEDIIRTRVMGQSMTNKQAMMNMFDAFMEQAAASGAGDLMIGVAQKAAARGLPGAKEWLVNRIQGKPMPAAEPIPTPPAQDFGQIVPSKAQTKARIATAPAAESAQQAWGDTLQQARPSPIPLQEMPKRTAKAATRQLIKSERARVGSQKATSQEVHKAFAKMDEALEHPNNIDVLDDSIQPARVVIKKAVIGPTGEEVKPAVLAKTPMQSPMDLGPINTAIEDIIELNKVDPFPAGGKVKQLLKYAEEYNAAPARVVKDALGELTTYAQSPTLRTGSQGMALRIRNNIYPLVETRIRQAATRAGMNADEAVASMKRGNLLSGQEWEIFGDLTPAEKQAQQALATHRANIHVVTPEPPPVAGAAWQKPPEPIRPVRALADVKNLSPEAWYQNVTTGGKNAAQNLDDVLASRGPNAAREILRYTLDKFEQGGNWKGALKTWGTMVDNGTAKRLTDATNTDLSESIPRILQQLSEVESTWGSRASDNILSRSLRMYSHVPMVPGKLKSRALADVLESPEAARRLNMLLSKNIASLPAKRAQVGGQVAVGAPQEAVRTRAAAAKQRKEAAKRASAEQ